MKAKKKDRCRRRNIVTAFLTVMLLLLLPACSADRGSVNAGEESAAVSVSLNGVTYTGSFEGTVDENGLPDGEGVFVTAETENTSFTLEGVWSGGVLNGKATVTYPDGSVLDVSFEDGTATGKATVTAADGTSQVYRYSNGVATGRVRLYSQEGALTDFDYYYNGDLVSDLCESALSLDYGEILSNPLAYIYEPLKVSGQVVSVWESESEELLIVEDSDGHLYLCRYKNQGYTAPQAWMPNLAAGDTVVLYGYLSDCITADFSSWTSGLVASLASEDQDYEELCKTISLIGSGDDSSLAYGQKNSTMPYLYLFYGEIVGESFDISVLDEEEAVSYDYDLLCRYPYYFVNLEYTGTCTVKEILLDYDSKEATMVLQAGEGNQIFYASYSWSSDEVLPLLGEEVTVTGLLKGNAKIAVEISEADDGSVNYLICPKLTVTELVP